VRISPLAVVDPRAVIAEGCEIGPFCIVGPEVNLGTGNKLLSHVVVTGRTTIGRDNIFHPHSVIGGAPQDKSYKDEPTGLEIGDRNQIRENVTIHTGTEYGAKIHGGGITRVGSDNLLMVNCHIAHDVQVGSRCIFANNIMIAGHAVFGDNVVLNGGVGVNQFVTVGDFAYIAGYAQCHHDIPPFVRASDDGDVRGLNSVGLSRGGFANSDIAELEAAVRTIFLGKKPQSVAIAELGQANGSLSPHVKTMMDFLARRNAGRHGRYLESLRPIAK
jgi:UDP-N-acetylglucosamine acyltransferase